MKTLYDSLRLFFADVELIDKSSLKTSDTFNLRSKYMTVVDKYRDEFKKDCEEVFGVWYKDNQTKRNVSAFTRLDVNMKLYNEDRAFVEVFDEMQRIGLGLCEFSKYSWDSEHFGKLYYSEQSYLSCQTYKQYREGNYKWDTKTYDTTPSGFIKSKYSNGYNYLPTEDMDILRQKLYDCIKDVEVEIYKCTLKPRNNNTPNLPQYHIAMKAIYDRSKLKKLLTELKNDQRLQRYATIYDQASRGISDYYASKHPGEYTGD